MQYPNRIVKAGEKDKDIVKAIQQKLSEQGYGQFGSSGAYGPKTIAAVKQFQAMHADQNGVPLIPDGQVGAITWAILFGQGSVPESNGGASKFLTEALKVAQSQVGITEKPIGSNRGPEVDEYLKSVNCPPGNFWCAGFLYWCFNKAAKNLNMQNPVCKTAGCLFHWNNTDGKKIKAKDAMNNPTLLKPGQVFIMDFGKGMGHTGIIEKVSGGFIHTIEGNSNNTGSRNGVGVFRLARKIGSINKGYIEYS